MPPKFMTLADLSKTDSTKKRKASSAFEGAGHTLSGKQTKRREPDAEEADYKPEDGGASESDEEQVNVKLDNGDLEVAGRKKCKVSLMQGERELEVAAKRIKLAKETAHKDEKEQPKAYTLRSGKGRNFEGRFGEGRRLDEVEPLKETQIEDPDAKVEEDEGDEVINGELSQDARGK